MFDNTSALYVKILRWGIIAILVIAPFYAPIALWIASSLHHLDLFKIWKEVALTALAIFMASFLLTHGSFAKKLLVSPLVLLIIVYCLLLFIIGAYDLSSGRVTRPAVIYGWLTDIRPVGFFLITYLIFAISRHEKFKQVNWRKIILIPAAAVVIFGFLQMTVLPKDILRHVGYGPTTITPYQTVDNQPDIIRIQSTARGPNPLGAYLVVIITILTVLVADRKNRARLMLGGLLLLSLVVLFGTYSRSAELGLIFSWLTLFLIYENKFLRKHLYIAFAGLALIILLGFAAASRHNYIAQNIFFHSSNRSTSAVSSNAQRSSAIKVAASDVYHHPLGGGIGSAGPASRRDTIHPAKIAENYYLQIGQEAGILGLALFLAINFFIAKALWQNRKDQLAMALFASFIGLALVVNMVSHAWADDTLAYIWWGLAGIALAPLIVEKAKKA